MADPSAVVIVIGGQTVTPFAQVGHVRIDDILNDAPNTASLTLVYSPRFGPPQTGPFAAHAFDNVAFNIATHNHPILTPPPAPVPGASIGMYLGTVTPATQIFGGQITTREQFAEFDRPQHVRYHVGCVDATRLLNRRKVLRDYGAQSATAIVLDVLAKDAPMITGANVQAGLPTITGGITFTFEEPSRVLSRLAEKIGAYWYVDYARDLHFFTGTEAGTEPAPIVPGADFADLKIAADLTQVRTRVLVEGDGSTTLVTLPAGDAILPVALSQPFNPAGGMAKIGTSRMGYTGTHAGGVTTNTVGVGTGANPPPNPPPAGMTLAVAAGTPGELVGGPYYYGLTFETNDGGRSAQGGDAGPITIGAVGAPGATNAAFPPTATKGPIDVGVTSRYAQSFVTADGSETPATLGGTALTGRVVTNPAINSVVGVNTTGGQMAEGSYYYALSYLTPGGETIPTVATPQQTVTTGNNAVQITFVRQAPDGRVTGRRVYRSSVGPVGPVPLPWRHVLDIPNNNAGVQFFDYSADATLSPLPLNTFNSATGVGEAAIVDLQVSGDPRVTRRRLYRQDGAGEYRLIAEIPNNTATTYTDVVLSSSGTLAPTVNNTGSGAIQVSNIPIGPAGTVRRRLFRNVAGGGEFRELTTIDDNTTTSFLDTIPDSELGGSPLPAAGSGTGTAAPPTGEASPTLRVADLTGIPASGWVAVESQILRYTGTSTAGGNYLTGIPASGPGAITASIPAGAVVTSSPAIVGVAPLVVVKKGDAVQLIAQVDDAAAQAAIAAVEGGDGIVEHYIQDRRLSEAAAFARGTAELALFKTVETRVSYTTHDPNTRSGRTVSINLPPPTNLVGDFLIQRVTIDDVSIAKNHYPKRSVTASSTRFSFDDVLNRLLLEQT